jgi:MerR family copper efflux transcriptional regulator
MGTMRISELAERCGVPTSTLRFYETAGLLTADRTPAGYRVYGDAAVRRLDFIGAAKSLGLPLEEIAELLAVWEAGACAEVKADLQPRVVARLAEAERRAVELAAFTGTLRAALAHLDALPDRAEPCGPECAFLMPAEPEPEPGPELEAEPEPELEAERWRTAGVACSLSGEAMQERGEEWRSALAGATSRQIPDGVRLTLPIERVTVLAGLAAAEQECCPFFDFRFHLDGPELHVEVRAPAEGAELLADLFAGSGGCC